MKNLIFTLIFNIDSFGEMPPQRIKGFHRALLLRLARCMRKIVQIFQDIKKEFPNMTIDDEAVRKIDQFLDLFWKWNKKINLTAVKDQNDFFTKHILDCLAFEKCDEINISDLCLNNKRVLDMGSGAGLPGIILSLLYQPKLCVSVDKSIKKIHFQNMVKANLSILNFQANSFRLREKFMDASFAETFDTVVSRAFTQLPELLELSSIFLKNGGYALFWKGENWDAELAEVSQNLKEEMVLTKVDRYELNQTRFGGTILMFKKHPTKK